MPIYSNRQLKPAPAPLVLVPFKCFVAGFKEASAGWVSLHQHSHPAPFEGAAASWVCLHWQRNPAPGSGAGRVSTSPGPSTRCRWRFILVPVPIESDWPRHLAPGPVPISKVSVPLVCHRSPQRHRHLVSGSEPAPFPTISAPASATEFGMCG